MAAYQCSHYLRIYMNLQYKQTSINIQLLVYYYLVFFCHVFNSRTPKKELQTTKLNPNQNPPALTLLTFVVYMSL